MATVTYNPTAEQTKGLQFALAKHNAELAALNPPQAALTMAQYVQLRLTDLLNSFADAAKEDRRKRLRDKFLSLTPAQQDALLAQLGLEP